ncbi:GlxA family transcriptional regulator [Chelativorans sp. M5D2P16]|uniref:GlxA family transcriptional regulator n=1 Tax=Chelativorans sp. M5D2P16 TaxID=3095678 RepID=UPI002AC9F252|nr:helix-turn-helix domain-containing protein [Chelativorans sp. M5D2P16]MDZ5697846.1 helix-turn-helix domain-containing protein [Chelativorans sp. M5D2P16]
MDRKVAFMPLSRMRVDSAPARISLLALPETTPGALYGLHEIFSSVGVAWHEMTGEAISVRRLETSIVARDAAPYPSLFGPPIAPQARLCDAGQADLVIVTDLALTSDGSPRGRWEEEAAWIRRQFEGGAVVCSVCTGTIFLAESGLLDGVEATTHWAVTHFFDEYYPDVKLHPERILCPAGPEHRIVTGGGAGSWTDMALYFVARFCGAAEAVRIAKIFVLGDRSEGQLPFAAMTRVPRREDTVINRCQSWLADHYSEPNPVARMAALSGLSERTFKRRFKAATGYAPIDYVQALRIEEAKQMLETTAEPTDVIAGAVGYEDPAYFRRLFKRATGITPARYRQRYRFIGMAMGAAA